MRTINDSNKVIETFKDVASHRIIGSIIQQHSTNRIDIREKALDGLNLLQCKYILELGCGFGFFTEALKGKVHREADITGIDVVEGYRRVFMDSCSRAGFKGNFFSTGASSIKKFESKTFDLIVCCYSLYFFPEIIPEIARVLKDTGVFVAITHCTGNMEEVITRVREALLEYDEFKKNILLPVERLTKQFSEENGRKMLNKWFTSIEERNYENKLVFDAGEIPFLIEYLRFKWPLFTPEEDKIGFSSMSVKLQNSFRKTSERLVVTKDDVIFICKQPLQDRGKK